MTKNKPTLVGKNGNVEISIWKNTNLKNGQEFETESYTISKNYKVGEEWKKTNSFNRNELYKLESLIQEVLKKEIKITDYEE